ncbi:MAG: hypothetical protein HOW73_05550 [Polyangiaceae bacterium]|nr:hypothetical protein [Polyangiaceae bacterium]
MVLLSTDVPDDWFRGHPLLLSKPDEQERVVFSQIDKTRFPRSHDLGGRTVKLYRGREVVGEAKLGPMWIASLGIDFSDTPEDEEAERVIAQNVLQTGTRWLVADLPTEEFKNAHWARLSDLRAPVMPEMQTPDPDLVERAHASLAKMDTFLSAQSDYDSYYASMNTPKPKPGWDEAANSSYDAFTWRGERYLLARIEGGEACSFHATVERLFKVRGTTLVEVPDFESGGTLNMLIDVEGDGRLEVVYDGMFDVNLWSFFEGKEALSDLTPAICRC